MHIVCMPAVWFMHACAPATSLRCEARLTAPASPRPRYFHPAPTPPPIPQAQCAVDPAVPVRLLGVMLSMQAPCLQLRPLFCLMACWHGHPLTAMVLPKVDVLIDHCLAGQQLQAAPATVGRSGPRRFVDIDTLGGRT
jgi:hypothetical protein